MKARNTESTYVESEEYKTDSYKTVVVEKQQDGTLLVRQTGRLSHGLFWQSPYYRFIKVKAKQAKDSETRTYWKILSAGVFLSPLPENRFFDNIGQIHKYLSKRFNGWTIIYDFKIKSTVHNGTTTKNPNGRTLFGTRLLGPINAD